MSDMDRRTFVGAAALGGVAAAVLTSASAEAAGDNSGYFVIAEIVAKPERAAELRGLLVPYADKSAKEPGCQKYVLMEVIADGPLPDLRTVDEQGGARCPHGHA